MAIRLILAIIFLNVSPQKIIAQTTVIRGVVRKGSAIKTTTLKPSYDISQLTGKWQEIKRSNIASGRKIAFKDTLQLNFNKRDSVFVHDGINISQKGYAAVEGSNKLEVAGDVYDILSLSTNTLIINDGDMRREFRKKKIFYYETLGNIIISKENLSNPVSVNLKNVIGKWDVYRTQATPGVAEDSAIIKHVNFLNNENGIITGEITYSKGGITETLPVKAIFYKGVLKMNTSAHSWDLFTYKADGKEIVFGKQGGLVYFAKQL